MALCQLALSLTLALRLALMVITSTDGCATQPPQLKASGCAPGATTWTETMYAVAPLHGRLQSQTGTTTSREASQPTCKLIRHVQVIFPNYQHNSDAVAADKCKVQGVSPGADPGPVFEYISTVSVTDGRVSISGDYPSCHSVSEVEITY